MSVYLGGQRSSGVLKDSLLKPQKWSIPQSRKSSRHKNKVAWLNYELLRATQHFG